MKSLVIVGAGTGGTRIANRMSRRLPPDWSVTVVDPDSRHLYQPGLLFIPFGGPDSIERPRAPTLRPGVRWLQEAVSRVESSARRVVVASGDTVSYDLLVIASGAQTHPEETPGTLGSGWRNTVHDFYTLEGARALRGALGRFPGGRLVVDVVEMPIKCPVAPLEFLFLADHYFEGRGIRDRVELVFVTPLDSAFTRPTCSRLLGGLLKEKRIEVETEFAAAEVDTEKSRLRSYDEREVPFDLLVTIPAHKGAPFIEESGLGDEMGFVPTDPGTLEAKRVSHIFVLGDATNLPSSKAGSVAHFQADVLEENLLRAVAGRSPGPGFDGHANCFIESGNGKALLIDFNDETDPLPGVFPLPWLGPLPLLKEARRNHWAKLLFQRAYWNLLLPGRSLPISTRMSMAGKRPVASDFSPGSEAACPDCQKGVFHPDA
jgi:sulfide:quinone oxidoreductase